MADYKFNGDSNKYEPFVPSKPAKKDTKSLYNPNEYVVPSLSFKEGQKSTFHEGTDQTRAAMSSSPWYQKYQSDLASIGQQLNSTDATATLGGKGGKGGGGFKTPEYSQNFKNFQGGLYGYATNLMNDQSPFGQASINVRTRDMDMGNQQTIDKIKADFASRGQAGSPQEQKAIEQADYNNSLQRAGVMQQMAEADAQYGLQKSDVLRQYHDSFNQAEMQNRAMIMQGQQISRARAGAAASAASADAKWKIMMELNLADKAAGMGQDYEQQQFGRYMQGAQFDYGKASSNEEFQYTKQYNSQMMQLQKDLASQAAAKQKKGGILGFIGDVVGAIPGIGGLVKGAVSLFGGSSDNSSQASSTGYNMFQNQQNQYSMF